MCSGRLVQHFFFFFSSRRRHTRSLRDWSSDVCSSDLFYELVVFHSRIDVANSPTEASTHQVQMPLNLGIVRGFVVQRLEPPQCSRGHGQRGGEEKNPARPLSARRVALEFLFFCAFFVRCIVIAQRFRPHSFPQIHDFGFCSPRHFWASVHPHRAFGCQ